MNERKKNAEASILLWLYIYAMEGRDDMVDDALGAEGAHIWKICWSHGQCFFV